MFLQKPQMKLLQHLCLLWLNFLLLFCHNIVLMLWLGLPTETTWIGSGKKKNHGLTWEI